MTEFPQYEDTVMKDKINFPRSPASTNGGYSLVEVSLALLVVAIGLTSIFSLLPMGMKAARDAVNDTEVPLFAEYVLNTLDLVAGYKGEAWVKYLESNPGEFMGYFFRGVDKPKGSRPVDYQIQATSNPSGYKLFYWNPDYFSFEGSSRYGNEVFKDYYTAVFTYQLSIGTAEALDVGNYPERTTNMKGAVPQVAILRVWTGESIPPRGDPYVFYREILPYF